MSEDRTEFIEAVRAAAWDTVDGRQVVHTFMGSIGADWEVESLIETIKKSRSVWWTVQGSLAAAMGHHLRIQLDDGKVVSAEVRAPGMAPGTP